VTGTAPIDAAAIDPGETLLIAGPAMTAKRRLVLDVLAGRGDRAAAVVTTRKSASTIEREFGETVDPAAWRFRVIDCVSRQHSRGRVADTEEVRYVSSAGDLTGAGIKLSGVLQEFYHDPDVEVAGIGLHTLSAMLMYADVRRVYQFVHVITGRIDSSGFVGAFALDTVPGDTEAMDRLAGLFDGMIEVRDEPDRSLRGRGTDAAPDEWTAF
jgi:hypothetical protein